MRVAWFLIRERLSWWKDSLISKKPSKPITNNKTRNYSQKLRSFKRRTRNCIRKTSILRTSRTRPFCCSGRKSSRFRNWSRRWLTWKENASKGTMRTNSRKEKFRSCKIPFRTFRVNSHLKDRVCNNLTCKTIIRKMKI